MIPTSTSDYFDAKPQEPHVVIKHLLQDIFKYKRCTLLWTCIFSLVITILIDKFCPSCNPKEDFSSTCINFNIAVLGVIVACLAIVFAIFQGRYFTEDGKKAFDEQIISFVLCAFFQIVAIIITFVLATEGNVGLKTYLVYFIQIWNLFLLGDAIIELYTLASAVPGNQLNKEQLISLRNNRNNNKDNIETPFDKFTMGFFYSDDNGIKFIHNDQRTEFIKNIT